MSRTAPFIKKSGICRIINEFFDHSLLLKVLHSLFFGDRVESINSSHSEEESRSFNILFFLLAQSLLDTCSDLIPVFL